MSERARKGIRMFATAVLLVACAAILGCLAGCGGNGGGGGGAPAAQITLSDSQGRPISGQIEAGRSAVASLNNLTPHGQYEIFLFGPASTRTSTAPDGRQVTAYLRLTADGQGTIPDTIIDYDLTSGDYTYEIVKLEAGRDGGEPTRAGVAGQGSMQVVPLSASTPFVFIEGASGVAKRSFTVGETVNVRGQGFTAGAELDVYVVQDQSDWSSGQPLIDVSGSVTDPPVPPFSRSRSLSGRADTVTAGPDGAFAATAVWSQIDGEAVGGAFDIVVDTNRNGVFDPGTDHVNEMRTVGFVVQSSSTRAGGHFTANISVDANGVRRDNFSSSENVYAYINPQQQMQLGGDRWVKKYVVIHRELDAWVAGTPLVDVSGANGAGGWEADTVESGCTNEGRVLLWPANLTPGDYDIVIDVNRNGVYDPGTDILDGDDSNGLSVGFHVSGTAAGAAKRWTVMVYMGGDNNLDSAAITDLNEMEQVGSSDDVNIVVQIDRRSTAEWTNTRRYYVTQDTNTTTIGSTLVGDLGEVNMGDPQTLLDFVTWSKTRYPASNYLLILWDHGSGFRSRSRDVVWDETGTVSSLSLPEVSQAIARAGGVTVLGFDACLMAMVETAYQVSGLTSYVVASEDSEPNDGWEYQDFLAVLKAQPTMSAQQLAGSIVNAYQTRYSGQSHCTLSAVSSAQVISVKGACDALARALIADPDGTGPQLPVVNTEKAAVEAAVSGAQRFNTNRPDYGDLFHFAELLGQGVTATSVRNACTALTSALSNAITSEWHSTGLTNAHGLTVWLPTRADYTNHSGKYNDLLFARHTQWSQFLATLWELTYRIELTWGDEPRDLDSHLWDASGNHLYYPYSGVDNSPVAGAWLDLDDTTSYGPENISITYLQANGSNLYSYAVHLYSGDASSETSTVRVYRGSSQVPVATYTHSGWNPSGARYWHVFDINPANGSIISRDTMGSAPRAVRGPMPSKAAAR